MDTNKIRQLAIDYVAAFNRHDLDGLGALFDDAVTLRDWSLEASGRDAVLAANRSIFEAVPDIAVTLVSLVVEGRSAALELDIRVGATENLRVVDLLDFTEAGRLVSVRAFKG